MKPDCDRCQPLLSAYIDGETSDADADFIKQHVRNCQECREALESYYGIRAQIRRMDHPAPPSNLRRAVLNRVHEAAVTPAPKFGVAALLGSRGAVAGIATILVVLIAVSAIFLINSKPQNGYEVSEVNANTDEITIRFSRDVDLNALQQDASKLIGAKDSQNKPIEFDVVVVDPRTIKLEPREPLPPGESVQVTVNKDLTSKDGKQLPQPYQEVKRVEPATSSVARTTTKPPTTVAATTPKATTTVAAPNSTTTAPVTTTAATTTVATTTPVSVTTTVSATTSVITTTTPVSVTTPVSSTTPVLTPTTTSGTPVITGTSTGTTPVTGAASTCTIVPVRDFAKLLADNPDVAVKVGCPTNNETSLVATYQPFDKGFMWYDNGQIYVFAGVSWQAFIDTFTTQSPTQATTDTSTVPASGTPAASTTAATTTLVSNFGCTLAPANGFGKLWRENATIRSLLGCPRAVESSTALAAVQTYTGGKLYSNPVDTQGKRIYVLYKDGTFALYNDTFGS